MRGSGKDAREHGKEALQRARQGGILSDPRCSGNGARAEERAFACRIRDWGPLSCVREIKKDKETE